MDIIKAMKIIQEIIERQDLPLDDFRVSAYNYIAHFVTNKRKLSLSNNDLAFKLYTNSLIDRIEIIGFGVYNSLHNKEMHKYLEQSSDQLLNKLCLKLNNFEQMNFLNELKVCQSHPRLITKENNIKEVNIIVDAIKNPESYNKFFGSIWDSERVKIIVTNQFQSLLESNQMKH